MNRKGDDLGYKGTGEPEDVLRWAFAEFHPDIALAASFENTVLIDMMTRIRPDIRVFSIDTGRLPEETFQCAAEAEQRAFYRSCCEHTPLALGSKRERAAWTIKCVERSRLRATRYAAPRAAVAMR